MTTSYLGLIPGNHNPVALAREIKRLYGGTDFKVSLVEFDDGMYHITFLERFSTEQQERIDNGARAWEVRQELEQRQMSVFTDGSCKCDYEKVTSYPATILSLGRHGHCAEIIGAMVRHFGGWIRDEAKGDDEWQKVT